MSRAIWFRRSAALFAVATAALAFLGPAAEAGTATGTFAVSTTTDAACTFSTNPLTFPNYTTGTAFNVFGHADFTITCAGASSAQPENVEFTFTTGTGVFAMTSGANSLNYSLCQNAGCTTLYAYNTAGALVSVSAPSQTQTIYGEIPSGQTPPATATFTQTVTATLTY